MKENYKNNFFYRFSVFTKRIKERIYNAWKHYKLLLGFSLTAIVSMIAGGVLYIRHIKYCAEFNRDVFIETVDILSSEKKTKHSGPVSEFFQNNIYETCLSNIKQRKNPFLFETFWKQNLVWLLLEKKALNMYVLCLNNFIEKKEKLNLTDSELLLINQRISELNIRRKEVSDNLLYIEKRNPNIDSKIFDSFLLYNSILFTAETGTPEEFENLNNTSLLETTALRYNSYVLAMAFHLSKNNLEQAKLYADKLKDSFTYELKNGSYFARQTGLEYAPLIAYVYHKYYENDKRPQEVKQKEYRRSVLEQQKIKPNQINLDEKQLEIEKKLLSYKITETTQKPMYFSYQEIWDLVNGKEIKTKKVIGQSIIDKFYKNPSKFVDFLTYKIEKKNKLKASELDLIREKKVIEKKLTYEKKELEQTNVDSSVLLQNLKNALDQKAYIDDLAKINLDDFEEKQENKTEILSREKIVELKEIHEDSPKNLFILDLLETKSLIYRSSSNQKEIDEKEFLELNKIRNQYEIKIAGLESDNEQILLEKELLEFSEIIFGKKIDTIKTQQIDLKKKQRNLNKSMETYQKTLGFKNEEIQFLKEKTKGFQKKNTRKK